MIHLLYNTASVTTSRLKKQGQLSGSAGETFGFFVEGRHRPGAHAWVGNRFAECLEKVESRGHVISQ